MLPTLLKPRQWSLEPFDTMRHEMDRVFGRLGGNGGWELPEFTAEYPVDIHEDDKCIRVDAEMPGFKKEEVAVTLENGILSITAEHKEETKPKGKEHLHERRWHRVERSFTMPSPVDEGKVDARLCDGVLHLVINKAAQALPQKIKVQ